MENRFMEAAKKFASPIEITEEEYRQAEAAQEKDFFEAHYFVTMLLQSPHYFYIPEMPESRLMLCLLNSIDDQQRATARYAKIISIILGLSLASSVLSLMLSAVSLS